MKKLLKYIVVLLPILIILYLYYYYDESASLWSIQCSFFKYTGLQCPGCGGQRALHYLLHGELIKALRYNALLILAIPFLLFIYYTLAQFFIFKKTKYIISPLFGSNFIIVTVILLILFSLIRNLPFAPFLFLSPPT